MKAAVFSDTHSNTALLLEAVRRCRPDAVIHLGDYERDTEALKREFPDIPLFNVCGNCDMFPSAPLVDTVQLGPVKALICHGHTLGADGYDMSPWSMPPRRPGRRSPCTATPTARSMRR